MRRYSGYFWVCCVVATTGCIYGSFGRQDHTSAGASGAGTHESTSSAVGSFAGSTRGEGPASESTRAGSRASGEAGAPAIAGGGGLTATTPDGGADPIGTEGAQAGRPSESVACDPTLEAARGDLCVAKQVMVGADARFSIDVTEVTQRQYALWLRTTGATDLATQDASLCAWNDSFEPNSERSCTQGTDTKACIGPNCGNYPQTCVDWCDAYAYCLAVGKRLCGRIGGGHNVYDDPALAETGSSQWYAACSSGGLHEYPYGDVYQPSYCNTYDYWVQPTEYRMLPVRWLETCQASAPFAGVFDLSGNVWEWEDACRVDTNTMARFCKRRGGDFSETTDLVGCSLQRELAMQQSNPRLGFRCCSE